VDSELEDYACVISYSFKTIRYIDPATSESPKAPVAASYDFLITKHNYCMCPPV
jgi:hypothetical protein